MAQGSPHLSGLYLGGGGAASLFALHCLFFPDSGPELYARNMALMLRIIEGSATTYFHLEFAGGPMTIVGADGLPVKPVEQKRFLISVAETHDILVRVPEDTMGADGETEETRGVGGFDYLLPLNIEWRFWVDTDGGARLTLEEVIEMTPRLMLRGEVEYDTHEEWEGMVTLSYVVARNLSLVGAWHSEYSWGGGVNLRF